MQKLQTFLTLAVHGLVYVIIQRMYDIVFIPPCLPHAVFNFGQFGAAVATNIHTFSTIIYSFNEYSLQKINESSLPYQMSIIYNYVEEQLVRMNRQLLQTDHSSNFKISEYFIAQHKTILMLIDNNRCIMFDRLNDELKQKKLICCKCNAELIGIWQLNNNEFYCVQHSSSDLTTESMNEDEQEEQEEEEEESQPLTASSISGLMFGQSKSVTTVNQPVPHATLLVVTKDPLVAIQNLKAIQQQQQ